VARVACDDEDRVVAGNRADDLVELRTVDRDCRRVRLARARPQDDELLDAVARLKPEAVPPDGGALAVGR
jgi:hypothetical protein